MGIPTRGRELDKPASIRIERDPLGEVEVPAEAYYGPQTARALKNFPISDLRAHGEFIRALAQIKRAAAEVNLRLGAVEEDVGKAIAQAAREVAEGGLAEEFQVDVFQAGAGTSLHMNMNEVLANRAAELLGGRKGDYRRVHPNDHVNFGQSTNDVFPTAMRLACLRLLGRLLPELSLLAEAFAKKGEEFRPIIKSGRTHMQDAAPVSLGREFEAYGRTIEKALEHLKRSTEGLYEVGIGGSAVGTGLNTLPGYREGVMERLRELTGVPLRGAPDLMEAMNSMAPFVSLSGALRALAVELTRIANDLRLLSSGPRTGFSEVILPPVQPGSSIMPGKVNPVMAEALNMVAYQVMGNDLAISLAAQAGQLELNVMMPLISFNLLFSLEILTNALRVFRERCVVGILARAERCRSYAEDSLGLATVLNPYIGYDAAAQVAKEAQATGRKIREIVLEKGLLSAQKLDEVLFRSVSGPEKG